MNDPVGAAKRALFRHIELPVSGEPWPTLVAASVVLIAAAIGDLTAAVKGLKK